MNATGDPADTGLRRTVALVASLNLAYFGIEFGVALATRSVALFADSVDFLEDAAVNLLVLAALSWTAKRRAQVGMLLAAILLAPSLAMLWALWSKLHAPVPPDPASLGLTGLGALAVNLACAAMLARHRDRGGSLGKAAFLSARNDAFAGIAIVGAGLVTLAYPSVWPDVIVGLGIAAMNADAARDVWQAATAEKGRAVAGARDAPTRAAPEVDPGLRR